MVVSCGTIKTAPGPAGPRLVEVVAGLRRLIAELPVREAALEELFMGRNSSSVIGVAQARGAILYALQEAGVPVSEYKPSQVKSVLTGYGAADKGQMARVVGAQFTTLGKIDEHAVDAIAIAICHSRSRRLRAAVAGSGR